MHVRISVFPLMGSFTVIDLLASSKSEYLTRKVTVTAAFRSALSFAPSFSASSQATDRRYP